MRFTSQSPPPLSQLEPDGDVHMNQDEKSSTEDEKRLALNSESWLKTEFEQNFQQMRDRDARIIEIVKFYATIVLGIATAIVALMGLKDLKNPSLLIGLLLLATCGVGEILLMWLVTFRKYFVLCARQINAIRQLYVERLPSEHRDRVLQPTDPSFPPVLHIGSAQMIMMGVMTLVNALLAALGIFAITSHVMPCKNWARALLCLAAVSLIVLLNVLFIRKRLKVGGGRG